ncbi:serine/threonine-protein kinase [Herbiconiux ginsengi]|uniref:non-specific serine/threonine protein kinase n=1 Tax=Herbiconiux ginsengi TaxID=381665 RepID=A0A1H3QIZ7_9MICO|nr:serine/threonine-protein kinase [Herbiconiux ginsengi]SDZ12679.1 Serine/threonine protein kinase [Herbiconiux ginsengi]
MVRRLPSPPPSLPGFTSVRVLGSGGFADVFLFEQNMPRRQVAVKVMLPEVVNEQVRRMFQVEADLMAKLSAHPSILTVYEAGVSSDGRPYLVMELCSSSLGQRYRSEPLPVAEVLRIGVKIAGALHTAHEQGILHRDVKPSNILLTAYGAPVLSDFGISASTRGNAAIDAVGLSIPWSAPEVLSEATQGTVASEVWALAATLYSLLAGRSPFEQPGGSSAPGDLARRITKAKLAPIGRSDVPASLERVLARGMAKDPARRPASALELLRELQAVETELGLAQTSAEIAMAEWAGDYARDPSDRTVLHAGAATGTGHGAGSGPGRRRRASASTAARAGGSSGSGGAGSPSSGSADRHKSRTSRVDTGERWGSSAGSGRSDHGSGGRGIRIAVIAAASVVVVGGLAAGGIALSQQDAGRSIPSVGEISATTTDGRILFSWNDPGLRDGDSYRVTTATGQSSVQRGNEFAAFPTDDSSVCISVAVVRAGKSGPASSEKCAALE